MSDWLPSLNALRAFETVSRHLSYRLAAQELHVTPAAVKQLVGKLEDALGKPLLRRRGRGIGLTEVGEVGVGDLQAAFDRIGRAMTRMREADQRQQLKITVEPSFAAAWLVPRLDDFKGRNPEVDVLIDSSMRIVDLERQEADIGIRYAVEPGKEFLVHRLFDDETLAVCSPALAEGPPALGKLEDLEEVTLIHMELSDMAWISSASHWFNWRTWLEAAGAGGIKPRRSLRFNDYNLAIQAAVAGHGVVLGSLPIVRDAIEANLLVSPFVERGRTDVGYDLMATREAMAKPEVASFVEWILERIEPPAFSP